MSDRSVFKGNGAPIRPIKFLVVGCLAGVAIASTVVLQGVFPCKAHAEDAATPAASPATDAGDSFSHVVQDIFRRSQNAVIKIQRTKDDGSTVAGTGFFIDPDGTIYTSFSVGGDTQTNTHDIVVAYGDKKFPAQCLLGDPRSGLSILKIDAATPFLPIGKTGEPPAATPVLAVGYPMDLPLTPSLGMVAGLDSKDAEGNGYFLTKHIRANVAVQRGQGGAPLLNLNGEVVGIIISGLQYGPGCYALPIDAAEKVRKDFVRFGDIHHGWIGIHVRVPLVSGTQGPTTVDDLLENTPASKCGLQKGDVLLQIGDKKITAAEDVLDASFFLTAGDEVPITVLRGNDKITVKVLPIPDVTLNAGTNGLPLKIQR